LGQALRGFKKAMEGDPKKLEFMRLRIKKSGLKK
jgi:hypothetical protein